jgi:hypothetical protein
MVNPFDPTLAKPSHSMGNSSCKDLRKSSDGVTFNHASGPVPVARSAPGHTRPARTGAVHTGPVHGSKRALGSAPPAP